MTLRGVLNAISAVLADWAYVLGGIAIYEEPEPSFVWRAQRDPRPLEIRSLSPDLDTQLEDLLNEVWRQEAFERSHPFTCGVIRATHATTVLR